jgi:VanZ family protein
MSKVISRKTLRNLKNRLPALVWAALIFMASTDAFSAANTAGLLELAVRYFFSALSHDTFRLIHTLIRKLGHFSEYFVLAVLVIRALRQETDEKPRPRRLALGLGLTALYAVSDELHQAFVPGRTASAADVLLDVFGGLCGTLWFHLRNHGKVQIGNV